MIVFIFLAGICSLVLWDKGAVPPGTSNRGAGCRAANRGFYFVIKTARSSRHRPQLFFVGAGLRARPQDFSKDNTGSGKNGKIALPARFHSALARGVAAYANSVHAGACLSPTIKVVTGLKESR